ncbi:NnrU family protein [Rhodovibrionaceae bacterium A322]
MTLDPPLGLYLLAAFLLFFSHAIPSAPGLRSYLMDSLGTRTFRTLYSLLSLVVLAFFVWAYLNYDAGDWIFEPPVWAAHLAVSFMPLVFFLVLGRVMTPLGELQAPKAARGIYLLIRFPGSSGLLIWSLLHLLATGDLKRVVLFATMAAISLFALLKNNWVLAKAQTPDARYFRQTTSNIPLAGLLAATSRGQVAQELWKPLILAFLFYGLGLWLHPFVFGVDPLYWI